MELEEALRHAGRVNECDVEDRARQALPHYMFTDGPRRKRTGYCTNCLTQDILIRRENTVPDWVAADPYADDEEGGLLHHPETQWSLMGPYQEYGARYNQSGMHGDYGDCPICGARVRYRSFNMGRKTLSDRIFLIQYRKSRLEENALVMLGWLVICDWGKWDEYNERLPELYTDLREICVFRPGKGGERFTKHVCFYGESGEDGRLITLPVADWKHPKKCVGGFDPWSGCGPFNFSHTKFYLDENSVQAALDGTWRLALYEEWKDHDLLDRIGLMEGLTRYGCLEYLEKLGFRTLAQKLAFRDMDMRLINVRGKTAPAVLRIDGNFYGWLKGCGIDPTPSLLSIYHLARSWGLRLGNETLLRMSGDGWGRETLQKISDATGRERLEKTIRYILKKRLAVWEYIDHLRMMGELGMDTRDSAMIWPRDFHALHTELSQRLKIKADAEKEERIAARADGLPGWWFSALGLTIRPFLTAEEIIQEGNAMRHCVGTYVDRYMNGGTILLALRQDESLTKPWRTVEYSVKGQLVQCRGYRNQSPEDEQDRIDEFLRMFDAYRQEYAALRAAQDDKRRRKKKEDKAA